MHALVVDDDPCNRKILCTYLQKLGVSFETASNGLIAVDMVKSSNFDVVWMDCCMPHMDGFQATEILRQAGFTTLYIIAVIASGDEMSCKCTSSGMDRYVSKPVTFDVVKAIVEELQTIVARNTDHEHKLPTNDMMAVSSTVDNACS